MYAQLAIQLAWYIILKVLHLALVAHRVLSCSSILLSTLSAALPIILDAMTAQLIYAGSRARLLPLGGSELSQLRREAGPASPRLSL